MDLLGFAPRPSIWIAPAILALALPALAAAAAAPPASRAVSAADRADAEYNMRRGSAYFDRGDYRRAISRFEMAHRLVPAMPGPWRAMGMSHLKLGEYDRAIKAFEEFLRGKTSGPDVEEVRRALAECRELIWKTARLRVVSTPAGAAVRLGRADAPPVGTTPLKDLPAKPGPVKVFVTKEGFLPATATAPLKAGATASLRLSLERAGEILVRTTVPDVRVLLDGGEVARTPVRGPLLAAHGTHKLVLERRGYERIAIEVKVGARAAVVDANPRPIEVAAAPPPGPSPVSGPPSEPGGPVAGALEGVGPVAGVEGTAPGAAEGAADRPEDRAAAKRRRSLVLWITVGAVLFAGAVAGIAAGAAVAAGRLPDTELEPPIDLGPLPF